MSHSLHQSNNHSQCSNTTRNVPTVSTTASETSLPTGWQVIYDVASKRKYYANSSTGETTWDIPHSTPLPHFNNAGVLATPNADAQHQQQNYHSQQSYPHKQQPCPQQHQQQPYPQQRQQQPYPQQRQQQPYPQQHQQQMQQYPQSQQQPYPQQQQMHHDLLLSSSTPSSFAATTCTEMLMNGSHNTSTSHVDCRNNVSQQRPHFVAAGDAMGNSNNQVVQASTASTNNSATTTAWSPSTSSTIPPTAEEVPPVVKKLRTMMSDLKEYHTNKNKEQQKLPFDPKQRELMAITAGELADIEYTITTCNGVVDVASENTNTTVSSTSSSKQQQLQFPIDPYNIAGTAANSNSNDCCVAFERPLQEQGRLATRMHALYKQM